MLKNFMYFTILTFFVILVWISLTIYQNYNPTKPAATTTVNPIVGSFNFDTIARLKGRTVIPVNFSETFISTPSSTTTQTISTESSSLNPTPIATTSSEISTSSAN